MKGKIHLNTKIKGTSFLIKHFKFKQNLEKKKKSVLDIPNRSHIHQLSLTYFGDFEHISVLYFTSAKNKILLLDASL